MEELRQRIAEDLSDLLEGEIHTDEVTCALYATDASIHEIMPVAVVQPRTAADVEALSAWASDNEVPVIPRGAGTGLAGGALGRGIVVDFSRHMHKVIEVGPDFVRVEPGVVHADLNRILRNQGRCVIPSTSRSASTTIGGMLAVDAAGAHAFRVGSMRDHVMEVECVLMGGQRILFTNQEPVQLRFVIREPAAVRQEPSALRDSGEMFLPPVRNETLAVSRLLPMSRRDDILERLTSLLDSAAEDIRSLQPMMLRNACGYMLRGVRKSDSLDVARLLSGSEGTLGIFTEIKLHTMPIPEHRILSAMMFGSMDDALRAVQLLLDLDPSACDLLDRRLLSLAQESDPRWEEVVYTGAEAGLFLEFTGSNESEIYERLIDAGEVLTRAEIRHVVTETATSPEMVDSLWKLPQAATLLLARLKGVSQPIPIVEDIAVPPAEISRFMTLAQKTFQRHEVTATLFAHAATGQLHLRPLLPFPVAGTASRMEALARDLYHHVRTVGGTITGQNGDGLSRTAFIRSQYGRLYRVFQNVKDIFDPQRLLNPDKIISDDGGLTVRHLRKIEASPLTRGAEDAAGLLPILELNWTADEAMQKAAHCDGCGECRSTSDSLRMCPFFRQQPGEDASPRSKANLIRRALSDGNSDELFTHEEIHELASSCFNCRQCQLECPSMVDIPHLMLEARAQYVRANGLSRSEWLLSRIHTYSRLASRFAPLTNRLLGRRFVRRLLERTLGIAEQRRLPRFARQTFLNSSLVRRECSDGRPGGDQPTVVYFVDHFANYHDTRLAHAFFRIMQHHGFRVFVPRGQTISGMSMLSVGDTEAAREVAETNLRELGGPAREGFPVLCTEPSAALCLSQEYPLLLDHPDASIVADQTQDIGTFLKQLHSTGKLRTDFQELKLRLLYHTPCHVKALGSDRGLLDLLRLIPGVTVDVVDRGCTGMAGSYGVAAENFDTSMAIGAALIEEMRTVQVNAGTTDCSTCRMQMEQGVDYPTVHPLKILAWAWGLMPEISQEMESRPSGYRMS